MQIDVWFWGRGATACNTDSDELSLFVTMIPPLLLILSFSFFSIFLAMLLGMSILVHVVPAQTVL